MHFCLLSVSCAVILVSHRCISLPCRIGCRYFEQKMSQKEPTRTSSHVALQSDAHKQSILSKIDKLRKKDLLCDITLVVEDVPFRAHKALLAASSDYFSRMFTADDPSGRPTYRLDGVAAEMFAAGLEFIYSAQVSVEVSATERLLTTARHLEIHDLVKVLAELTSSAAADQAEAPDPSKRKRGRPKKRVDAPVSELEPVEDAHMYCDVRAELRHQGDTDYDPGAHRQSKRRIRPPLKYKGYKVGNDTAGSKEPGKRGRKRKYPNTEARCEDCDKVFKSHLFLKIHQRTHTGNLT